MPLDAMKDISDDALLVLFANGDRAAARALTLRLTPRVLAHAQRLLGNAAEAEDVAQEAMLRLWKVAPDWRQGDAKVTTWLYRVVANLCTDRLRKARPLPLDAAPELVRLPRRQRQAVVLRRLEDLGNPEIAGIMEISVEAVESLLTRGRRALAVELAGRRAELGFADEHE